jgi:hypothetical protein
METHDHSGGDGGQIAYASLSGLPTLGTAAAKNTGTNGDAVPLLNGANTWSASQSVQGVVKVFRSGSENLQYTLLDQDNSYSGSAGLTSFSDTSNAKPLIINATTDGSHTPPTGGEVEILLRTLGLGRVAIKQSGNVGIGTYFPAEKLHVAGVVRADSGIKPSASSDAITDYQDDTFTPGFATWDVAPTSVSARAIKIGKQVTVRISGTGGTTSNSDTITGLPYANENAVAAGMLRNAGGFALFGVHIAGNQSTITLGAMTLGANTWALSITYFTA